jgi:ankyrin repeat protein
MLSASSAGSFHASQLLLTRGASVNALHAESGLTALHIACGANNAPGAALLLKAGAAQSLADAQGRTPLHWAALSGSTILARKLLRRAARSSSSLSPSSAAASASPSSAAASSHSSHALLDAQDASGYTALMTAAEHGREEVVRMLLSWGANAGERKLMRGRLGICPRDRPPPTSPSLHYAFPLPLPLPTQSSATS